MPDLVGTEIHLFNNINMKNQKAFFMRESTETSLSNLRIVNEVTVPGGRHVKGLNAVIKNNLHSLAHVKNIRYLQVYVTLVGNIFLRKIMNLNKNCCEVSFKISLHNYKITHVQGYSLQHYL